MLKWFKRKKAKEKTWRSFMAGLSNRLAADWVSHNSSPDRDIERSLPKMRARSRELANNNPYAKKYLSLCSQNVVGESGIQLQSRIKSVKSSVVKQYNRTIEDAFARWGEPGVCDVTGKLSWLDCQRLFIKTVARDGEVLIRKIVGDNDFGFAIQLLEADHLDSDCNQDLGEGRRIRMGVEMDAWGKPIAYHLKKAPYFELNYHLRNAETIRVPAEEIIHAYIPERPNQTRGVPWLHAAMFQLHVLQAYQEAELLASRISACKMGFFTRNEMGQGFTGCEEDEKHRNLIIEPGKFDELPYGVDFKSFDPQHPADNYQNFVKSCLRSIASATNVSYTALTNDLESTNYSSIRAGLLEEREHWKTLQAWMIDVFCEPIFSSWLSMAELMHQLPGVPGHVEVDADHWQARRWEWVDPHKDQQGLQLGLSLLQQSWSDSVRQRGGNPSDILERLAEEKESFEQHGIGHLHALIYQTVKTTPSSEESHGKTHQKTEKH